jgi:hypothetical protein
MTSVKKKMKQRHDFSDNEIDCLEKEIDDWTHQWIDLVGEAGMRYSNQYKNKQTRYVYHQRNQMGGNYGSGQRHSTRQPLEYWFLRCLWWMTREFPHVLDAPLPSHIDSEDDGLGTANGGG